MITLDHAFLSDYAADRGGSVGAMGIGIDTLHAAQFPVTHPHLFLVTQLRCPKDFRDVQAISVSFRDANDVALLEQTGHVDFRTLAPGQEGVARLLFGFYLVQFPRAEEYHFTVKLGESLAADIPFTVQLRPLEQTQA